MFINATGNSPATTAAAIGTSSASQSNVNKTLEQRAQDGDQIAKMELKEEQPGQQTPTTPASEPGKGENVDKYI